MIPGNEIWDASHARQHFVFGVFCFIVSSLKRLTKLHIADTGRTMRGLSKGQMTQRIIVTDGQIEALTGTCVYFLRSTTEKITQSNFEKVGFCLLHAVFFVL